VIRFATHIEADEFAARHASSGALIDALIKLYKDNATTLTPDPVHSTFYNSHPPASIRIERLLKLIGLTRDADKFPTQLSGGMQQRLQIARCLAQDPVVLLMDEPFGALDAITRQALQDEIQNIAASRNSTVLFVTHDLEEAIYLGTRVFGMTPHPGKIVKAFDIDLPRPRDQRTTPEHPKFLRLRRALFDFIKEAER